MYSGSTILTKINNKDRDKMIVVFDIMIDIYYDIIKIICGD